MCVVEVKGKPNLTPSCAFPAEEGMEIQTRSPRVINAPAHHHRAPAGKPPLRLPHLPEERLLRAAVPGLRVRHRQGALPGKDPPPLHRLLLPLHHPGARQVHPLRPLRAHLRGDPGRCGHRLHPPRIRHHGPSPLRDGPELRPPASTAGSARWPAPPGRCTRCGRWRKSCRPSRRERSTSWRRRPRPSACPWGTSSACPPGPTSPGKVAAALRRMGFRQIFDTDFAADLTIMEEGTELVNKINEGREASPVHLLLPGVGQVRRASTTPSSFPEHLHAARARRR